MVGIRVGVAAPPLHPTSDNHSPKPLPDPIWAGENPTRPSQSSTPQIGNRAHHLSGAYYVLTEHATPHLVRDQMAPLKAGSGTAEAPHRAMSTGGTFSRRATKVKTQGFRTAAGLYGFKATIDPGYLIHPQLSIVRCVQNTLRTRWATTCC